MAIRKLPDGSVLDTDTGALLPGNPAQEAAARRTSERAGAYQAPVRNKGQQIMNVVPAAGKNVINPVQRLAISPYSAMGADPVLPPTPAPPMSDTTKRFLMMGGIVAAAFGVVWLNNKMKGKGKK